MKTKKTPLISIDSCKGPNEQDKELHEFIAWLKRKNAFEKYGYLTDYERLELVEKYFSEREQSNGKRKYGHSIANRPLNPTRKIKQLHVMRLKKIKKKATTNKGSSQPISPSQEKEYKKKKPLVYIKPKKIRFSGKLGFAQTDMRNYCKKKSRHSKKFNNEGDK